MKAAIVWCTFTCLACEELFIREKLDTVWLVNWRVLSRLIIAREGAKYSNCRHVTCILILSAHKRSAPEISFHLECQGSGNHFFLSSYLPFEAQSEGVIQCLTSSHILALLADVIVSLICNRHNTLLLAYHKLFFFLMRKCKLWNHETKIISVLGCFFTETWKHSDMNWLFQVLWV